MERISSRQNSIVRRFRRLAQSPRAEAADGGRELLLDGAHLLEDALACGVAVDTIVVREDLIAGPVSTLTASAEQRGARVIVVTGDVLSAISPVRQPSGVVAIARHHAGTVDAAFEQAPQLVLILVDVQDPGNVGAIVRVADACGATGLIASPGTADPFGWKALRGSMGSAFRVPIAERQPVDEAIGIVRQRGIRLHAAVPRGGTPLPQSDLRGPSAVLLGGEGGGLPDALVASSDDRLTIPMRSQVESLNVATAAALITYEAQRQRARTIEAGGETFRGRV